MSNQNECTCTVCLGVYDNNLIDGVLQREWIRCTNTPHVDYGCIVSERSKW